MKIFKGHFIIFLSLCALLVLLPGQAYSLWRTKAKPKVVKHKAIGRKKAAEVAKEIRRHKMYKYIKSHDYNNDGIVDSKDRLLWIKNHKLSKPTAYISKENEDILEEIDANGDGSVTPAEMESFYSAYDTNSNGILEDHEINAANE